MIHVNRRVLRTGGVALAALALMVGCGGGGSHGGGHGTEATATVTAAPPTGATHNQADIEFAQGMIPHHQQAVQMSELAESRAGDPRVKALATKIKAAQAPEIEQMTTMLTGWGVPVPSPGHEHDPGHGGMPGMMTGQEMTALEAASGAEFDRMFLQMMIRHHQGAVEMAGTEQQQGIDPAARSLAGTIKADQVAEIEQMQSLLDQR